MIGLDNFYKNAGKPKQDRLELFANTFLKHGSDKTGYHNYETVYSNLFSDLNAVTDVLEMGIHMGASLRAWKELFPNAKVVGLENNPQRFFTEDRITSFYVDQSVDETFTNFINFIDGREFQFIVDDGSHYLEETHRTFIRLLPSLAVNGWFIVEDIRSEFEDTWLDILDGLSKDYEWYLINLNNMAQTRSNDNIVAAVRRKA